MREAVRVGGLGPTEGGEYLRQPPEADVHGRPLYVKSLPLPARHLCWRPRYGLGVAYKIVHPPPVWRLCWRPRCVLGVGE
jgi:hypothetical protein